MRAAAHKSNTAGEWYDDGSYEPQWLLIGRTPAGRVLTVACQLVERDGAERFRPVTAWSAMPAEEAKYRDDSPED